MKGRKTAAIAHKKPITITAKSSKATSVSILGWFSLGVIVLITSISFYNSLSGEFTTWDDPLYVTENKLITSLSTDNIIRMFSFSEPVAMNYHPLTMLSLAADYKVAELDAFQYHRTNVIIHLLNTLLVFFFAYRLSGRKWLAAFLVSLFFGVHPMHVENVAWVSARKDLMYTFFFIAGLIIYLKYVEASKTRYILFVFVLFTLSLLSKAMAVVFPVVMLLIDYYKGRKITWRVILEKIPFFILSFACGVLATKIQAQGAIASYETFTFFQRICIGFYGFFQYTLKFFLPMDLSSFYPYPLLEGGKMAFPMQFYGSAITGFLILILGIVPFFYKREKLKHLAFGFGFYFITIVLVLQFISVGQVIMADRYSYLPYVGLLFTLGAYLENAVERFGFARMAGFAMVVLVAIPLGYLTHQRNKVWKNTETLWSDVIRQYPFPPWKVESAFIARGKYYADEKGDFQNALADFNILLAMKTKDHFVYNNLGSVYGQLGRQAMQTSDLKRATDHFTKSAEFLTTSLSLDSSNAGIYANRATCYIYLNKYELALSDLHRSLTLQPDDLSNIEKRAFAELQTKRWKEAIADYDRLIAMDNKPNLLYYRGYANMNGERYEQAVKDFNDVLFNDPRNAQVYHALSICYLRMNDRPMAEKCNDTAMELGFVDAQGELKMSSASLPGK